MKLTDYKLEILKYENDDDKLINDLVIKNKTHSIYGWHYSIDYRAILTRSESLLENKELKILDIGCGPNLNILHSYIENYKKINVEGIDFAGKNPKIEFNFNFNQLTINKKYDLIIAVSALEHQKDLNDFELSLNKIYEHLNNGGIALITLSINISSTDNIWDQSINGWLFGVNYLNEKFNTNFTIEDIKGVIETFNNSEHIKSKYYSRFGSNDKNFPRYIPLLLSIQK